MELRDGILYQYYKPGLELTLEVSKAIVRERLKFLKGKTYPVLVLDEGLKSIDRASRYFFATDEGLKGIFVVAFITSTHFSRMINSFCLIRMHDANIEARTFTDIDEAIAWLKSESAFKFKKISNY